MAATIGTGSLDVSRIQQEQIRHTHCLNLPVKPGPVADPPALQPPTTRFTLSNVSCLDRGNQLAGQPLASRLTVSLAPATTRARKLTCLRTGDRWVRRRPSIPS